jgi:hypothetical protein
VTDTCKPEDNPLLNGVYIWTETTSAGHVFVSVHENNNIFLYTYGRYGRTDKYLHWGWDFRLSRMKMRVSITDTNFMKWELALSALMMQILK